VEGEHGSQRIAGKLSKKKVMKCIVNAQQPQTSGKYPCGICRKGVERNSLECTGAGSGFTRSVVVSRVLLKRETTTAAQCAKDKPVIEG